MPHQSRNAFSLLELSLVIALIGIVAGAVFVGQSFVNRHKLRAVLSDATAYAVAIQQFKSQYGYLPGDFPEATRVWGSLGAGAGCTMAENSSTAATDKRTCDGDGNGIITPGQCETYRAWQHLANAGMAQGSFTGAPGNMNVTCAQDTVPGVNVPENAIKKTGYWLGSVGIYDALNISPDFFDGDYSNVMIYARDEHILPANRYALTAQSAREIDQKVDDGLAATGSIRSYKQNTCTMPCPTPPPCTSTITGAYDESSEDIACAMIFMSTFQNQSQR